jgi:uncharacterized protein
MRGRPPKLHLSRSLRIWADADACPAAASEALFAIADRRRVVLTMVSTASRYWPNSAFIRSLVVAEGFGGVNERLRQLAMEGDVIVSADTALLKESAGRKIVALPFNDVRALTSRIDELLSRLERQTLANIAAKQRTGEPSAAVDEAP